MSTVKLDSDYQNFLNSKKLKAIATGFEATFIPDQAFDFQRDIIKWTVKRGKAAVFADTGSGKTLIFLTWSENIVRYTQGNILILSPLAVSHQTVREGQKFGISVNICKDQKDVKPGINITNYERLHLFDPSQFVGLVLDESSCIKGFESVTRKLINDFAFNIHYRLACTATPAPNDTIEITNHSEFLGIMSGKEIIALYFTQDGNTTQHWRLKGHAKEDFYKWLATWAIALRKPSDLGYEDKNFILPKLNIIPIIVDSPESQDTLFPMDAIGLNEQRQARKESLPVRLEAVQKLVAEKPNEPWLIWCDLNLESEKLEKNIPNAVEVKGSDTTEHKEKHLLGFSEGTTQILVSKSSICGFGMNWQHCNNMIFFGLNYSFEGFYQAIRRCWRFGQTKEVNVYIVISDREVPVYTTIQRKQEEAEKLLNGLVKHMAIHSEIKQAVKDEMVYKTKVTKGKDWTLYLGDSIQEIDNIKTESIGLSVYSPPFPLMYAYSNSQNDLGNTRNIKDFIEHFRFLVSKDKLLRVTMPGRLSCIHLMQLNAMKSREGYIGVQDYRGKVIQMMIDEGWIYAGEVTIDKNPQLQAVRNKERGLLFKSLATDSSVMRMALADYLLYFRKPGDNPKPIHAGISKKYNPQGGWITEEEWIEWASPVWYRATKGKPGGIRETDVLNVVQARETDDERHLCLAKGTLVLTQKGYTPIEEIEIGDLTLTHKGRWMPIIAKACMGTKETIQVKAQGVPYLRVTPDHKLWTRSYQGKGRWPNSSNSIKSSQKHKQSAIKNEPEWIQASETLSSYVNLKLPPVEESIYTEKEWWIAGRWLADGHYDSRGGLHISCGYHKYDALTQKLGEYVGFTGKYETVVQIRIKDTDGRLRQLLKNCGHGAKGKTLPKEALALDTIKASALLSGYLSGDGHYCKQYDRYSASSVSRSLLLGFAIIAQRVKNIAVSVYAGRKPGTTTIENRSYNTLQDWILSIPPKNMSGITLEDGVWKKVRALENAKEEEVWDIQVAEDASFTAEGCIVKNCPLQLGVIERAIKLWSAPGDTVFSPFNGIGSEGYMALKLNRKYIGIELKESYYNSAILNLQSAEKAKDNGSLLDLLGDDQGESFGSQGESFGSIESENKPSKESTPFSMSNDHLLGNEPSQKYKQYLIDKEIKDRQEAQKKETIFDYMTLSNTDYNCCCGDPDCDTLKDMYYEFLTRKSQENSSLRFLANSQKGNVIQALEPHEHEWLEKFGKRCEQSRLINAVDEGQKRQHEQMEELFELADTLDEVN